MQLFTVRWYGGMRTWLVRCKENSKEHRNNGWKRHRAERMLTRKTSYGAGRGPELTVEGTAILTHGAEGTDCYLCRDVEIMPLGMW